MFIVLDSKILWGAACCYKHFAPNGAMRSFEFKKDSQLGRRRAVALTPQQCFDLRFQLSQLPLHLA